MRSVFFGLVIFLGSLFTDIALADGPGSNPLRSRDPIFNSFGERIVFQCQVPVDNGEAVVNLEMTIGGDLSLDFLTVTLGDVNENHIFFTQLPKGQLAKDIKSGELEYLMLTEESSQSNGVVTQSGYLMITGDDSGGFSGLIAVIGNVYPLVCEAR